MSLYSQFFRLFPKISKTIYPPLTKLFHKFPQRMSSKFVTMRAKKSSKYRSSKVTKKNIRNHAKKNFTATSRRRMTNRKTEELRSLSKSEKISLNRLYSWGRAAYGSVRNLSKPSGLSKKNVEQFLQTNTSYIKQTKFVPQSNFSESFKHFQNI